MSVDQKCQKENNTGKKNMGQNMYFYRNIQICQKLQERAQLKKGHTTTLLCASGQIFFKIC